MCIRDRSAQGAAALLQPVVSEADIMLTFLDAPNQCRTQRGTAGRAADIERCGLLHAPPRRQYGPSAWIVCQDLQGLEQKTHYDDPAAERARERSPARHSHPVLSRSTAKGAQSESQQRGNDARGRPAKNERQSLAG